jgi:hypothetical protein
MPENVLSYRKGLKRNSANLPFIQKYDNIKDDEIPISIDERTTAVPSVGPIMASTDNYVSKY